MGTPAIIFSLITGLSNGSGERERLRCLVVCATGCSSSDEVVDDRVSQGTSCTWVAGPRIWCGGLSRCDLPEGVRKGFLLPETACWDSIDILVLFGVLSGAYMDFDGD